MKLWEIRERRKFVEKQEARDYLHTMRIVNAGFNGGESATSLQNELHKKAFPPIITLEMKKKPPRNWIKDMISKLEVDDD